MLGRFFVDSHVVDFGDDFQRRSELHGHGSHQVVGFQQHKRLAVDFLDQEVFGVVRAPGQVLDELKHFIYLQQRNENLLNSSISRGTVCTYRPFERIDFWCVIVGSAGLAGVGTHRCAYVGIDVHAVIFAPLSTLLI